MTVVFNLALHVLLIGSLLLFTAFIFMTALTTQNRLERGMRVFAIFGGALVALGAQASGANYATFTVNALAGARPASAAAAIVTTVIPGMMGVGIGFYITRTLRTSESMAMRIMCFVGMLAITAFIQVYAQAASTVGFELGAAAVPNVAFTAGVILTAVFTLRTEEKLADVRPTLGATLVNLIRERRSSAGHTESPTAAQSFRASDEPFRGL